MVLQEISKIFTHRKNPVKTSRSLTQIPITHRLSLPRLSTKDSDLWRRHTALLPLATPEA